MPLSTAAMVLLALAPGGARVDDSTHYEPYRLTQVSLRYQSIVRVPRLKPRPMNPMAVKPVTWKEKKGPKCVALASLAGALITQPRSIDLVQQGGGRVRAQIDKHCPSLDFYSGFYLKPTADGQICAGRDSLRTRAGRSCEIGRFRTLVAER